MNLDSITVELLEKTLKAWKSKERDLPPDLLDLALLGSSNSDLPDDRKMLLMMHLKTIASETLARYRKNASKNLLVTSSPISPSDDLQDLRADFSLGSPELEAWSAVHHLYLASLNYKVGRLAEEVMPQDKGQFRRRVRTGLGQLVAAVKQAEFQARQRPRELPLPAPEYSKLFGVKPIVEQILGWLQMPEDSDKLFISIEALGGWGKTAIAREVAGEFLRKGLFADIVWISARHEELDATGKIRQLRDPARSTDDIITRLAEKFTPESSVGLSRNDKIERLKAILRDKACLVIIDNLESISDSEELMPVIFPLAGKTRFLLTSRASLGEFPYVYCVHVPELSHSDSFALIKNELHRVGRRIEPSGEDIEQIYQIIGGVPLALKLVTSQLKRLSLPRILEGLREARQREDMYTYIYRRTWLELLDESARLLLLSLKYIPPEGEDEAWVFENSLLPQNDFDLALKQLLDCALLEITGSLDAPRYHLHRLTATFLQSDILSEW